VRLEHLQTRQAVQRLQRKGNQGSSRQQQCSNSVAPTECTAGTPPASLSCSFAATFLQLFAVVMQWYIDP
jgi:hypothetical protein